MSLNFSVPGMTVLTVIATDADSGNNGSVTYSLKQVPMKGNQPLFSIDSYMGLISTMLNNALDREVQSVYHIIVQAKDRGSPPMSCGFCCLFVIMSSSLKVSVFLTQLDASLSCRQKLIIYIDCDVDKFSV